MTAVWTSVATNRDDPAQASRLGVFENSRPKRIGRRRPSPRRGGEREAEERGQEDPAGGPADPIARVSGAVEVVGDVHERDRRGDESGRKRFPPDAESDANDEDGDPGKKSDAVRRVPGEAGRDFRKIRKREGAGRSGFVVVQNPVPGAEREPAAERERGQRNQPERAADPRGEPAAGRGEQAENRRPRRARRRRPRIS